MYAGLQRKMASNVPFTIVILNLLYMASHLGNNSRCGYWFCKGDSFDETLQRQIDSKLTFNSLKEIDVFCKTTNS
jgi:hypothetical protein